MRHPKYYGIKEVVRAAEDGLLVWLALIGYLAIVSGIVVAVLWLFT